MNPHVECAGRQADVFRDATEVEGYSAANLPSPCALVCDPGGGCRN